MSGSDPIYGRPYAIAGKGDGVRATLNARDLGENREWERLAGWAASVAAQLALLPSAGKAPRKDAERGVAQPRGSVPPESRRRRKAARGRRGVGGGKTLGASSHRDKLDADRSE